MNACTVAVSYCTTSFGSIRASSKCNPFIVSNIPDHVSNFCWEKLRFFHVSTIKAGQESLACSNKFKFLKPSEFFGLHKFDDNSPLRGGLVSQRYFLASRLGLISDRCFIGDSNHKALARSLSSEYVLVGLLCIWVGALLTFSFPCRLIYMLFF